MYTCFDCNKTFQNWAEASNHEHDTRTHLTYRNEATKCACGCGDWTETPVYDEYFRPFVNENHLGAYAHYVEVTA